MDRRTESSTAKKLIQWELVKLSFDEKIGMKFPGSIVSLNLDMVKMNSKVGFVIKVGNNLGVSYENVSVYKLSDS